MTMCKIHILSTHSVLLDILTVINTHYTPYVHILHYVHIYTIICNVMDVHWMVSSGSRLVVVLVQCACSPVELCKS